MDSGEMTVRRRSFKKFPEISGRGTREREASETHASWVQNVVHHRTTYREQGNVHNNVKNHAHRRLRKPSAIFTSSETLVPLSTYFGKNSQ